METEWRILKNLKIELPYDPSMPLLGIEPKECESKYSKRHLYTHVYCSTILNKQAMETVQMSYN
jgi:hypothetical protein